MNREELERQARRALAAAGDMASRGAEWVRNYRDAYRESQVGICAWFHRMMYGRDDFCEFGVYHDRIELADEFQKTVISSRLDKFESGWSHSLLGPSLSVFGLIIVMSSVWVALGKFIGFCVVAAVGWFVWHVYRRSLMLTIDMKDEEGRKIVFEFKRGDFSGPPLPVQALNEMVETINGMCSAETGTRS